MNGSDDTADEQKSGTDRNLAAFVSFFKDLFTLLRDALIFVLVLLLLVFPRTFNDILNNAGFVECSLSGCKWQSEFAKTRDALVQLSQQYKDLQNRENTLQTALSEAAKFVPEGTLKTNIGQALQTDPALQKHSAEVEDKARETVQATAASEKQLPSAFRPNWAVVFGGDKDLQSALDEIRSAGAIPGIESVKIFHRQGSYRSVSIAGDFERANQQRDILRAKHRADSYIVNLNNWCPEQIEKSGYIECSAP